jgi:hypothetical protein
MASAEKPSTNGFSLVLVMAQNSCLVSYEVEESAGHEER